MIIEIDENGKVHGLYEDLKEIFDESSFKVIEKKRFSHIVPENIVKRVFFKILRRLFSDEGKVAQWTRNWKCSWIVTVGNEKYGPFKTRKEAIEFEKNLYYQSVYGN